MWWEDRSNRRAHLRGGRVILGVALLGGALAAAALAPSLGGKPAAASGNTLYVAKSGSDANPCTQAQPCHTIRHAVGQASAGDTIKVAAGTYFEGVDVTKQLTIQGTGRPTVNAVSSKNGNGFYVHGPAASGSVIDGFKVTNALFEGILVQGVPGAAISNVTIKNNLVIHNDTGFAAQAEGECHPPAPEIPGDCGEGLHFWSAVHSTAWNNTVEDNAGGILLTDEFGPNHDNLISKNTVLYNQFDCGVTVVGHNGNAVATSGPNAGKPQPTQGGTYHNTISDNVIRANGGRGEGAGVIFAAAAPGTGSYDNTVRDNDIEGNGLSGVAIHSHFPLQDVNGNVIKDNTLRMDNLSGDNDFSPGDNEPTGVLVAAGLPPGAPGAQPATITGTEVEDNDFADVYYGIWTLNANVDVDDNSYADDVLVHVFHAG